MVNVVEYSKGYRSDVENLLVQLQNHFVDIDNEKIRVLKDGFEKEYFKYIEDMVLEHDGKIFLAILNEKVVGVVIGYVLENTIDDQLRSKCPKTGRISKLVIDQESRSCGVGQTLIEVMEEYLKKLNCEYINIEVFGPNLGALKFYEKNGYTTRMYNVMKKIKF